MKDLLLSIPIGTCKDFTFSKGVLKSTKTLCRDSETEWELNSFSSGWDTAILNLEQAEAYLNGTLPLHEIEWDSHKITY